MTNTNAFSKRVSALARTSLALAVPAAALATPLLTAAPAQAAADCRTDCVSVSIKPGVDRFTFTSTSSSSVRLAGKITEMVGGKYVAATNLPYGGTSYSLGVSNLPQGKAYHYDLYATDLEGNTWREQGNFATLVRDVKVHFSTVQITDDGDAVGDPGEIVAAAQLWTKSRSNCDRKPLAPFSMTTTRSTSSGSPLTVGSSSDLACSGVEAGVSVEAHMGENDVDFWDGEECDRWWPWRFNPGSFGGYIGGNDCADWNYSSSDYTDPLPALGTGQTSTSFSSTAEDESFSVDWDAGPEWILNGTLTWIHRYPAVSLPLTTGAQVKLPVTLTPQQGGFTASWSPAYVPGVTFTDYLVQWRKQGQTAWVTQPVTAPTTSATIGTLDGATTYDVQVVARDASGMNFERALSSVTTKALPAPTASTLTGWSATPETKALGASVPFAATVSGEPRPVLLQNRQAGQQNWQTVSTLTTGATHQVAGSIPVQAGIAEWRLYAPQSGGYAAVASEARKITAQSTITGFDTTKVTKPVGAVLSDSVVVTPGAGRQVQVQYRKAGTDTWTTSATLVGAGDGSVTAQLKAFAGTTYWRVRVSAAAAYGGPAQTASRTVVGQ